MDINFYKYQGTGNDFVILDNRTHQYDTLTNEQVKFLCDRKFGIGSDGLMMLNMHEDYDFEMVYYNADGHEGSMCGNGGRCLVKFASDAGIKKNHYNFIATDGLHEAEIDFNGEVRLKMKDVASIEEGTDYFILNTGSPHYVKLVNDLQATPVKEEGRKIRNSKPFDKDGINVNFVEAIDEHTIFVRTYERGVEDETLSCGTGVTAAALISAHNENGFNEIDVKTTGGNLCVEFETIDNTSFSNIWLRGAADFVFKGQIKLK
ncbi:MAG: diaminopimelate epimerase [Chitinophagaceae bacterium]|nr:diaminopimelate epimerase [Chitinophagaceae bacterium]